jgi:hypothetical protein
MGMQVKDAGESECAVVMMVIRVSTLPDAKAGRLPAGLSLQDNLENLWK